MRREYMANQILQVASAQSPEVLEISFAVSDGGGQTGGGTDGGAQAGRPLEKGFPSNSGVVIAHQVGPLHAGFASAVQEKPNRQRARDFLSGRWVARSEESCTLHDKILTRSVRR